MASLSVVGITQEMIDDLPVRAGALREAQSIWFKDRYSQEEAQREWKAVSPEAYDLRDELLHDFRYAFRNDPVLMGRVSAISIPSTKQVIENPWILFYFVLYWD